MAFLLLEGISQATEAGEVLTVPQCVAEGPVVQYLQGTDHDPEAGCAPGCALRHAFYYVRVRAFSNGGGVTAGRRGPARRLDVPVDLCPARRAGSLSALLLAPGGRQGAWVVLEVCSGDPT